jgi:hypothetical protein
MAGTNYFINKDANVMVALTDENDNAILAKGLAANVPTGAGYALGCEYIATDTGAHYYNSGTTSVASFTASSAIATVALSSAQILALNATPVTLIAAPGANKVIIVRGITLKMVTTSTQYANGGALEFRYTNASGAKVSADIAAAVVTAAAGTSYTSVAGVTTSLTGVVNSPIVIDNATAPFITGTGTGVITINYDIITA